MGGVGDSLGGLRDFGEAEGMLLLFRSYVAEDGSFSYDPPLLLSPIKGGDGDFGDHVGYSVLAAFAVVRYVAVVSDTLDIVLGQPFTVPAG